MVWVLCVAIWGVFVPSRDLLFFSVWLVYLCLRRMHHCGIAKFEVSGPTVLWRIWGSTLGLAGPAVSSGHARWRVDANCVTDGPCRCWSTWLIFFFEYFSEVIPDWVEWNLEWQRRAGWFLCVLWEVLDSYFYSCPEVCRETPHLHVLFDFLPRGGSVLIRIEGWEANYVSPIFFGLLIEAAWTVYSVERLMTRPSVPVILAKFDDIHVMILLLASEGLIIFA
jgi:hypothetical protein